MLLLGVLIFLASTSGYYLPVLGPTPDMCSSSEYVQNQATCSPCPEKCSQCFLANGFIQCSSCAEGYFFSLKKEDCVVACEDGYRQDASTRQCIQCQVRFCDDCSSEIGFLSSQKCLQCSTGYFYDETTNLCRKTCQDMFYDTLDGTCVDHCSDDKMQSQNMCISNVNCPKIDSISDICSMSKIIKLLIHPDGERLIAVGLNNINIFLLPDLTVSLTHSITFEILDCVTLEGDSVYFYCFNSIQQVIQFDANTLNETVHANAKGYLRGQNDLYPGRLEGIILVTTSIDVIERINIQSGEISRKYLQKDFYNEMQSGRFWFARGLCVSIGTKTEDGSVFLLLLEVTTNENATLTEISLSGLASIIKPKQMIAVDSTSVIFYSNESLISCTVIVTSIKSEEDFKCPPANIISFSNKLIQNRQVELFLDQQLMIFFSQQDNYLDIFHISKTASNPIYVGSFSGVIQYSAQDGIVFLVMANSTIKIVTINRTLLTSGNSLIIYSEVNSMQISQTDSSNILGFIFHDSQLLLNNQLEIFLINLPKQSNGSNLLSVGGSALATLSDQRFIEIQYSSKCESQYTQNTLVNVYKDEDDDDDDNQNANGWLIFVHFYSVICKVIVAQSGKSSFEYQFSREFGKIIDTEYYSEFKLLVVFQHKYLSVLDLQSRQIVFQLSNYDSDPLKCNRKYFLNYEALAILCKSNQTMPIFNFQTLSVKNISFQDSVLQTFQDFSTEFLYLQNSYSLVNKYDSLGELIESFQSLPQSPGNNNFAFFDGDIQVQFFYQSLIIFDLKSSQIVLNFSFEKPSTKINPSQFFLYNDRVNAIVFLNNNEITWYSWDKLGQNPKTTKFLCPGDSTKFLFQAFFTQGNFIAVLSQSESILCIVTLNQSSIEYIEDIPDSFTINTFVLDSQVFFYISRQDLTKLYMKLPNSSTPATPTLYQIADYPVRCQEMRLYDDKNGICLPADYQNPVHFPMVKKLEVGNMATDFEVISTKSYDNYLVLIGQRKVFLNKKQQMIFAYQKTEMSSGEATIKDVEFLQDTKELIVVWTESFIEHFNVTSNSLVTEITEFTNFIAISETQRQIIYSIIDLVTKQILVKVYSMASRIVIYSMIVDSQATAYQFTLNDSQTILFLLSNNQLYRLDLSTGENTTQSFVMLFTLTIQEMIASKDYLILLPQDLQNPVVLDAVSLTILDNPSFPEEFLPSTQSQNQIINNYSLVTIDKVSFKYLILDITSMRKIVILSLPSLSIIQTFQNFQNYNILDVDKENNLLCTVQTDGFVMVYHYSEDISSITMHLPIYSVSVEKQIFQSQPYKGASFLKSISAKIMSKYSVIIISFDDSILIYSIIDGSLRQLIKESTLAISYFFLYQNNYLITYGNQGLRLFNIDHVLFPSQDINYAPYRFRSYQVAIGNEKLLSDSELAALGFPFEFSQQRNIEDDIKEFSAKYSIGQRVQLIDDRYSIEIDPDFNFNLSENQTITSAIYDYHRIFYISQAGQLHGVKGPSIFKILQLPKDLHFQQLEKFFFVSKSYVILIREDLITVFSFDLEIVQTLETTNDPIRRVLVVPSEINQECFIFLTQSGKICKYGFQDHSVSVIFAINNLQGNISYYFLLTPSADQRILLIGFEDSTILAINLSSFTTKLVNSLEINAPHEKFVKIKQFFASKTHIYLKTIDQITIAVKYTVSTNLNQVSGESEPAITFDSIIKLGDNIIVLQMFFDVSKDRIILFTEAAVHIQYARIIPGTPPSTEEIFQIISTTILKPSSQNTVFQISKQFDLYVFYCNMYIIVIHSTEMKLRAFISEPKIKGTIRQVYLITQDILIVTTNSGIYTVVFLQPSNSATSPYFIANSIPINEANIVFHRFQRPAKYKNIIYIILEAISSQGTFTFEYPISIMSQNEVIQCGVSFKITDDKVYSSIFKHYLEHLEELNIISEYQTYNIQTFDMTYIQGGEQFYTYMNGRTYDYLKVKGAQQESVMWVTPSLQSMFSGANFYLQNFLIQAIWAKGKMAVNKMFSGYTSIIWENIVFDFTAFTFQLLFQQNTYVKFKKISLNSITLDLNATVKQQYPNLNSQQLDIILSEEEEEKLVIQYVFTSLFAFWNVSQVDVVDQMFSKITLNDFSAYESFVNINKVNFWKITMKTINVGQRYYDQMQLFLFMKVHVLTMQDVVIQDISLKDITLMQFIEIGQIMIQNMTIQNVTCSTTSSNTRNLAYLLDFKGILNITINSLTVQNVKDCRIIKMSKYQVGAIKSLNQAIEFKNVIFQNITFQKEQNTASNRALQLDKQQLLHLYALQPSSLSFYKLRQSDFKTDLQFSPPDRVLSNSQSTTETSTSSPLIEATVINISLINLLLKNISMYDTPLISFNSQTLQMTNLTISDAKIIHSAAVTQSNPAIQISTITMTAALLTLLSSDQVDFSISATQSAIFDQINFSNCNFSNIDSTITNDIHGIFSLYSIPIVQISNSLFQNNLGDYKSTGIIYLTTIQYYSFQNCSFFNNRSVKSSGGAIALLYSDGSANLIENCKFYNNSAPQHSGGAIYAYFSDFTLKDCVFKDNFALIGGAIRIIANYYSNFYFSYLDAANVYISNYASIYGDNVGLFPKRFVNSAQTAQPIEEAQNYMEILDFKSGDNIEDLSLAVIDNENSIIRFMNYSESAIHSDVLKEISSFILALNIEKQQTSIFVPLEYITYNTTTNNFDIFMNLYITPGKTQSLVISTSSNYLQVNSTDFQFVSQPLSFTIHLTSRLCKIGEVYQELNQVYSCLSCPDGKYSFEQPILDQPNKVTCNICPNSAAKCEINQIHLKNGFWRENDTSETIYPCSKLTMNCKAEEPVSKQLCGEGSIGPLCQSCDNYGKLWGESYARFADSSCQKCSDMSLSYFTLIVLFVSILWYVLVLIWMNSRAIERKIMAMTIIQMGFVRMGKSAIFDSFITQAKIFMNYLQLVLIMTELEVSLPQYFEFAQLGDPISSLTNQVDCLLAQIPGMNIVQLRVVWIFGFAFILAFIVAVIFLIAYFKFIIQLKQRQPLLNKLSNSSSGGEQIKRSNSNQLESSFVISKSEPNSQSNYLKRHSRKEPTSVLELIKVEEITSKPSETSISAFANIPQGRENQINKFDDKNQVSNKQNQYFIQALQGDNQTPQHCEEYSSFSSQIVSSSDNKDKRVNMEIQKNKDYQNIQKNQQNIPENKNKTINTALPTQAIQNSYKHRGSELYFDSQENKHYFLRYAGNFKMSFKILFFYLQPGIVKLMISSLTCVNYGNYSYIFADPQFICNSEYRIISFLFVFPILILIGIVIPLIMLFKLKRLNSKQQHHSSYSFFKSYGFLFQEYKSNSYFWEIYRMFLKNLISGILLLFSTWIILKLVLVVLVIMLYVFIQKRVSPYKYHEFNELDYFSNAVVAMSLILGLLITSTDILWLKVISGIAIGLINIIFLQQIIKKILASMILPYEHASQGCFERILFYLKRKLPIAFRMVQIRKSYSFKILLLWKKVALYVHENKELLLNQQVEIKAMNEIKSLLIESLRIGADSKLEFGSLEQVKDEKLGSAMKEHEFKVDAMDNALPKDKENGDSKPNPKIITSDKIIPCQDQDGSQTIDLTCVLPLSVYNNNNNMESDDNSSQWSQLSCFVPSSNQSYRQPSLNFSSFPSLRNTSFDKDTTIFQQGEEEQQQQYESNQEESSQFPNLTLNVSRNQSINWNNSYLQKGRNEEQKQMTQPQQQSYTINQQGGDAASFSSMTDFHRACKYRNSDTLLPRKSQFQLLQLSFEDQANKSAGDEAGGYLNEGQSVHTVAELVQIQMNQNTNVAPSSQDANSHRVSKHHNSASAVAAIRKSTQEHRHSLEIEINNGKLLNGSFDRTLNNTSSDPNVSQNFNLLHLQKTTSAIERSQKSIFHRDSLSRLSAASQSQISTQQKKPKIKQQSSSISKFESNKQTYILNKIKQNRYKAKQFINNNNYLNSCNSSSSNNAINLKKAPSLNIDELINLRQNNNNNNTTTNNP